MARKEIKHAEIVRRFGERLRSLRQARSLTQRELANRAEVTVTYISRLEAGGASPGIDLLERLAQALGAGVVDLLPVPAEAEPEQVRRHLREIFERVLGRAGPETLGMLRALLERLDESPPTGR